MKRCFRLITALLILSLVMTTMYFPPVYAEGFVIGEELIENGDFEKLDENGIPIGSWQTQKNWDPEYAYITQNKDGNSSNILKVEWKSNDVNRSYARYLLGNAEPGMYELSVDVVYNLTNEHSGEAQGLNVLIEFYRAGQVDTDTAFIGNKKIDQLDGQSNDRWVNVSGTFTAPEETELIVIWFLVNSKGEVWIDNLSCKLAGGPEPYSMQTDQVIYYTDDSVGTAKTMIHSYYKPDSEEYKVKVDYSLEYEDEILAEAKDVVPNPENGISEFQFDLSLMEYLLEKYQLRAVIKNENGDVIREFSEDIIRTERPKNLKSDGTLLVDGEPFYPVIGYSVNQNFAEAKAMGINTIHDMSDWGNEIEKKLDGAHENGMKVIVHLCNLGNSYLKPSGSPENYNTCLEWVEKLKDHPALLAWDMRDEPLGGRAPGTDEFKTQTTSLLDGYIGIRDVDPDHPVYLLDYQPRWYDYSQRYGDIFVTDIYVTDDTYAVTTGVQQALEAVKGRKPVYQIGQTYVSSRAYGMPTIDDIRGNNYRALAAGVKGFGYFVMTNCAYSTPEATTGDMNLWDCDVYDDIVKFAQEEQPELVDYYLAKKYQTFNKHDDGGKHSLYYESWIHGDDVWMVVHNRGNEEVEAKIPLYSNNGLVKLNGATAQAIGGTEENIDIQGNFLELTMPRQKVHLYKLTPKSSVDFSQVTVEVANPIIPGMENSTEDGGKIEVGTFSDLAGYEWASQQIDELFGMGILNQSTVYTYSPSVNVTRGDAVGFLVKTLGLSADVKDNFADVAEDSANANEIGILKALGIIDGAGDGCFYPETPITRQDLMKICARGMRVANKLSEVADIGVLDRFNDKSQIASYAVADVAGMVEAAIISGDDKGNINPSSYTTRAEVAVMMHRILNAEVMQTEPDISEDITEEVVIEFEEVNYTDEQLKARENAMNLFESIGLLKSSDAETALTRAQAAKLLVDIVMNGAQCEPCDTVFSDVSKNNEYSGYIAAAHNLGLMNGSGDGSFSPDLPITYHQFIKVLVDLMGYAEPAKEKGGYPHGYLIQANDIDLTDGVILSKDMPIKVSDAAFVLKNALDIDIMGARSYDSNGISEYKVYKNETILTRYLKLKKYEGLITGNGMQTISVPRTLKDNEIAMGDMIFDAQKSGAEKLFGYESILYATDDDDVNIQSVIFAEPARNVSVIKIDAEDIEIRGQKVYYIDAMGKERSLSVASDANVVYNGELMADGWTVNDFAIEAGQITFISDGSSYKSVLIEEHTNYEIDRVILMTETVCFTDGTSMVIDLTDIEEKITLMDTKGKNLKLNALSSGNIVSIRKSIDGTKINIIVCDDVVKGAVQKLDEKSAVINDTKYAIASNLKTNSDVYGEVKVGVNAAYRLDYSGNIASVDRSAILPKYGYLCGLSLNEGLLDEVKGKIFTTEGKMAVYTFRDKVEFNGTSGTLSKDVYASSEFWQEDRTIKQQLVIYKLNSNNEIVLLETAVDSRSMSEDEKLSRFTMDANTDGTGIDLDRWQKAQTYTLGHTYRWDSKTMIFSVPDRPMEDKYYSVSYLSSEQGDSGRIGYPLALYDIDENLLVPIGVRTFSGGSVLAVYPDSSADVGFITGFIDALSDDGDPVLGINVATMDEFGNYADATIYVNKEKMVGMGKQCLTTEFHPTKLSRNPDGIPVTNLKLGDAIQYEVNDKTGLVDAIRVWYRAETPRTPYEISSDGVGAYYAGGARGPKTGTVVRCLPDGFVITSNVAHPEFNPWEGRTLVCKSQYGVLRPVVVFEKDANGHYSDYTVATLQDIEIGDQAFALCSGNSGGMVGIYR